MPPSTHNTYLPNLWEPQEEILHILKKTRYFKNSIHQVNFAFFLTMRSIWLTESSYVCLITWHVTTLELWKIHQLEAYLWFCCLTNTRPKWKRDRGVHDVMRKGRERQTVWWVDYDTECFSDLPVLTDWAGRGSWSPDSPMTILPVNNSEAGEPRAWLKELENTGYDCLLVWVIIN